MSLFHVGALSCALLLFASACEPDKRPAPAPAPARDGAGEKPELPALGPVKPCDLEVHRAGPLRRAGLAQLKLEGSGGKVIGKDAPALCGPMYDKDSEVLQVKAGEGVLFEACMPEGLVQVSSFERVAGPQRLSSLTQGPGTDLSFNKFKGGTFSMRGDASDTIVFAADFWSLTASVHLRSDNDAEELHGTLSIACPKPNPAAPPAAPPAEN